MADSFNCKIHLKENLMEKFKALVISPSGSPTVTMIESPQQLREIIGGWLEFIHFGEGAGCYIHEEAKVPPNIPVINGLATYLCNVVGCPLRKNDYIAGTMVIFGTLDKNGGYDEDEHDIPESVLRKIREAIKLRYGMGGIDESS